MILLYISLIIMIPLSIEGASRLFERGANMYDLVLFAEIGVVLVVWFLYLVSLIV